ncbi:MAG: extracellular solute-binding protein [Pseudomonadota bacterium]
MKRFSRATLVALSLVVPFTAAMQRSALADYDVWKSTTSLADPSKYKDGFEHYAHVNPDAPKGGTLNQAVNGTFDSFNPFIVKGNAAAGLTFFGGFLWDTLMSQGVDEGAVSHALIAEAVKWPQDYSSATFRLNPKARWHDGKPITAEDVKWSMETLRKHSPQHVRYFKNVKDVRVDGERLVTFLFDQTNNRELPQIMGDLPVLPKHWWEGTDAEGNKRDFTTATLEPPLGSGPYKIKSFSAGSSIEWERVKDYWAADLPPRKGRFNFDIRKYTYFLDDNAIWLAFQKGGFEDIREENRAARWQQEYNFPAITEGKVKKVTFDETSNYPMVGWVPNLRRDMFKDRRVRKALNLAFNFRQMNEDLFFNQYTRLATYFGGSVMSATGLPEGREKEILEEFRGKVPEELFTQPYENPVYETRRDTRKFLGEAFKLLQEAGWKSEGGKLVNDKGEQFKFTILGSNPASERVNAPFISALTRLGMAVDFRVVDQSQYIQRIRNFEFDMVVAGAFQSTSPGNEQRDYWTSTSADETGSRNWGGIKNPVIDTLVDRIILAKNREELIAHVRALDRILLFEHYSIQQWYLAQDRVAYWDKFGIPEPQPTYIGYDLESWWIDPAKAAALGQN